MWLLPPALSCHPLPPLNHSTTGSILLDKSCAHFLLFFGKTNVAQKKDLKLKNTLFSPPQHLPASQPVWCDAGNIQSPLIILVVLFKYVSSLAWEVVSSSFVV